MNKAHTVPMGYSITLTAGPEAASLQRLDDGSVKSVLIDDTVTFWPYNFDTFWESNGGTVTTARTIREETRNIVGTPPIPGHDGHLYIEPGTGGMFWDGTGSYCGIADGVTLAPVNTVPPAVTGTANEGEVLTCDDGTFSPAEDSVTKQWYADAVAIDGETGDTYTTIATSVDPVVEGDLGKDITCVVTAYNAYGYVAGTVSNTKTIVAP